VIIVEFVCRDVAGSSANAVVLSSWRLGRCRLYFRFGGANLSGQGRKWDHDFQSSAKVTENGTFTPITTEDA
jgi:hypothetical protein